MKKNIFRAALGLFCAGVFFTSGLAQAPNVKTVSSEQVKVQKKEGFYLKLSPNGWYVIGGKDYVIVVR